MHIFQRSYLMFVLTIVCIQGAYAAPDRPLVLIPGILGSTLSREGKIVWGDRLSLSRFAQLEILDGPGDPVDQMTATGLIQAVQILGPWQIRQYDSLRSQLIDLGYKAGIDLFEFPYDWRQSNFTTAEKLRTWIDNNPRLRDGEFDLLAHSMGGLVAEIFVRRHDPNRQVRRVISLGTPFLGSATAIATPSQGWGVLPNRLAGGIEEIRRIVLSFPSIYELLPSYSSCCILGRPEEGNRRPYNILSPEGWDYIDWHLAARLDTDERRQRVNYTLLRAAELSRLVQEPLPDHLRNSSYRIAGDLIETRGQFYVDRRTRQIVHWNNRLGDGTVVVRSAAKDDVGSAFVSYGEHTRIFEDRNVGTTLKRILRSDIYASTEYSSSVYNVETNGGELVRVRAVAAHVSPRVVLPGDSFDVTLNLTTERDQPADQIKVRSFLASGDKKTDLQVASRTVTDSFDSTRVTFLIPGIAPSEVGPVRIVIKFSGLEQLEQFLVVLPDRQE